MPFEPLPNINKAYAMVLRVEKQRKVNQAYVVNKKNNVFLVKMKQGNGPRNRGRGRNNQNMGRGRTRNNDKNNKFCDYCNIPGHVRETCFQLNGFLDWYQQFKTQKENANVTKVETTKSTPFEYKDNACTRQDTMASMV